MLKRVRKFIARGRKGRILDYAADGTGVWGKSLDFMNEPAFAAAWRTTKERNEPRWQRNNNSMPDIRWRTHIACWAARHGLSLKGDFVECGVSTGVLSVAIAEFVNFASQPREFFLFDTFDGIPQEMLQGSHATNDPNQFDTYEIAKRNFAPYPNARLIKGSLPGTLPAIDDRPIAYLSVDLNNVIAEKAVIEKLWPQITPGAIILLDDYGFRGFEAQHRMWNDFASSHGKMVASLPTGQGLLIR